MIGEIPQRPFYSTGGIEMGNFTAGAIVQVKSERGRGVRLIMIPSIFTINPRDYFKSFISLVVL